MPPGLGNFLRWIGAAPDDDTRAWRQPDTVAYKGYEIRPDPIREGSHWLTAGTIAKTFEDGLREHPFVRGDRHGDRKAAIEFTVTKAQQIIDLEGDRLFE